MGDMAEYYREAADWHDLMNDGQRDPSEEDYKEMTSKYKGNKMTIRKAKKQARRKLVLVPKPLLIHCGKHFINPNDVSRITQIKKDLFVVKFVSEPEPEWACWVEAKDIVKLLEHFEIIESDNQ